MSSHRGSSSSSAGSKRRHEPETLEEAWRLHCKHSVAGSRRSAWRYASSPQSMPPSLVDFAVGGRYYAVDPPPRPMSGPKFEKWRLDWEQWRQWTSGASIGSSGASGAVAVAATADEDAAFAAAVELSKKDADEAARAEAEEEAQAIADVEAFKAREAAGVVVLDD